MACADFECRRRKRCLYDDSPPVRQDDATSRAREVIAHDVERTRDYSPSEAAAIARVAIDGLARSPYRIIDTRTHAAVPREPSDEVVERVARAIFGDDTCNRDRHGTNAIARAAIAALVGTQTQGGERDAPP